MKVNYQFAVAGASGFVKSALYKLVPVDVSDKKQGNGLSGFHNITTPLYGTLAEKENKDFGSFLKDFNARNVICPIVFGAIPGEENLVIPEAVVSITKKKSIVKTAVVGGKGTVKEFIGDDDMGITITIGIVAADAEKNIVDEYPGEVVKTIQKFLDTKTLDVWSPFLELFDIDGGWFKIVVESYDISQTTDTNRQVVTIKAVSDFDYTIFSEEN